MYIKDIANIGMIYAYDGSIVLHCGHYIITNKLENVLTRMVYGERAFVPSQRREFKNFYECIFLLLTLKIKRGKV